MESHGLPPVLAGRGKGKEIEIATHGIAVQGGGEGPITGEGGFFGSGKGLKGGGREEVEEWAVELEGTEQHLK